MRLPVDGNPTITNHHGTNTGSGRFGKHLGIDLSVKLVPVKAPCAGKITYSGVASELGQWLELIDERGRIHRFAHLNRRDVLAGVNVAEGQQLAISGNTGKVFGANGGYHVHWDVRKGGTRYDESFDNYFDPEKLVAESQAPAAPKPANAGSFNVPFPTAGYVSSTDAAERVRSNSTVPAGSYAVFNESHGMVNVTRQAGVPGWWINPQDIKAPAAPAPQPEVRKYTVVKGDSLSKIASKFGLKSYQPLYERNKALIGDNPNLIKPGQELIIP